MSRPQHAPAMIRTVPENRMTELLPMVSSGGAFAEAVFFAFNAAARAGLAKASGLKTEEQVNGGQEGSDRGSKRGSEHDDGQQDNGEQHEDAHRDKHARVEDENASAEVAAES